MTLTTATNLTFSSLTIIGQLLVVVWLVLLLARDKFNNPLTQFLQRNALALAFIVAFVATAGSLFYSEIIGFEPCKLCWLQRIFMYPQVILLGLALWKRDRGIAIYSIALSIIGVIIAAYHYLLQLGFAPSLPCSAVGYSVSCSQKFVLQFGYITIPMMALTAFIMIILFLLTAKNFLAKEQNQS